MKETTFDVINQERNDTSRESQRWQPILVRPNNNYELERVPLNERAFMEEWIQNLIHTHPNILPIREIEDGFYPLIQIGREIQTPAGYIDNLFISPDGYLTLVETKLWKNPEARREVVGQIIDYAKELSKWTYTDLDNCVKSTCRENLVSLLRNKKGLEEGDEITFIDNVSRNLKREGFCC